MRPWRVWLQVCRVAQGALRSDRKEQKLQETAERRRAGDKLAVPDPIYLIGRRWEHMHRPAWAQSLCKGSAGEHASAVLQEARGTDLQLQHEHAAVQLMHTVRMQCQFEAVLLTLGFYLCVLLHAGTQHTLQHWRCPACIA